MDFIVNQERKSKNFQDKPLGKTYHRQSDGKTYKVVGIINDPAVILRADDGTEKSEVIGCFNAENDWVEVVKEDEWNLAEQAREYTVPCPDNQPGCLVHHTKREFHYSDVKKCRDLIIKDLYERGFWQVLFPEDFRDERLDCYSSPKQSTATKIVEKLIEKRFGDL